MQFKLNRNIEQLNVYKKKKHMLQAHFKQLAQW